MQTVDIVLLVIIIAFAMAGFRLGVIQTIGSLAGMILGVFLAGRYYVPAAAWLATTFGWTGNMPKIVSFIAIFIIVNRLVGFVFWFIDRTIGIIARLPFIASINRLAGFVLGILEGVVTIGIAIYFIERFPLGQPIMQHLALSKIAPIATRVASYLWPFVPDAIRAIQSTINYVEHLFRP